MRAGLGVFGVLLVLAMPNAAAAHPVDEVVQGAYLTLTPGAVALELDLVVGPEIAETVLTGIDLNGDRVLDDGEAAAFAAAVVAQSRTAVDGTTVTMSIDHLSLPSFDVIAAGGDSIRLFATGPRIDAVGAHQLTYENTFAPVKTQRMANVFLRPGSGWSYTVTGQQHGLDGGTLVVDFTVTAQ